MINKNETHFDEVRYNGKLVESEVVERIIFDMKMANINEKINVVIYATAPVSHGGDGGIKLKIKNLTFRERNAFLAIKSKKRIEKIIETVEKNINEKIEKDFEDAISENEQYNKLVHEKMIKQLKKRKIKTKKILRKKGVICRKI